MGKSKIAIDDNLMSFQIIKDVQCSVHINPGLEFVYTISGELCLKVDKNERVLKEGYATFIKPYQLHSFKTAESSNVMVLIFKTQIVEEFLSVYSNKTSENEVFLLPNDVMQYIFRRLSEPLNIISIKGIFYPIVSEFMSNNSFKESVDFNNQVFYKALCYIDENFSKQITLIETADFLKIHPVHLSRTFTKNAGISFTSFLNNIRIDRACTMFITTGFSISDVAFESGFGSIRNFNRVFYNIMGQTPKEYIADSKLWQQKIK